jgi:folate-binding protein YgfZ
LSCLFTHLENEALLHISGPDARSFLQGQLSCDIRRLDDSHALLGLHCTPQGRVNCDVLLSQLGSDHLALRLRRDIRADSAALFAKYILFSKATLEAERDDWQVFACWGSTAAKELETVFGAIPLQQYGTASGQGFCLTQLDSDGEQFECLLHSDASAQLKAQLAQRSLPGHASQWQALQLRNGVARIETQTMGEFVPQMLNYDLTGHISFSKGCYTGQEVVARLHYRGKPKRRLYLASVDMVEHSATDCAPGTALFSSGREQPSGKLVNSTGTTDKTTLMLVSAAIDAAAEGLHVAGREGPPLTLLELPYEVHSA